MSGAEDDRYDDLRKIESLDEWSMKNLGVPFYPRRVRWYRDYADLALWALLAGLIVVCIVLAGTVR